jgi:hypothetical protein
VIPGIYLRNNIPVSNEKELSHCRKNTYKVFKWDIGKILKYTWKREK